MLAEANKLNILFFFRYILCDGTRIAQTACRVTKFVTGLLLCAMVYSPALLAQSHPEHFIAEPDVVKDVKIRHSPGLIGADELLSHPSLVPVQPIPTAPALPEGWCCLHGQSFASSALACQRRKGQFFDLRRDAVRHCQHQEQENPWTGQTPAPQPHPPGLQLKRPHPRPPNESFGACCLQGEVIHAPEHECRKAGGAFFRDRGLALRECRPEPEVPREEFLPAHGWCCARGEVFEAPRFKCRAMGGQIYTSSESARRKCEGTVPPPELHRQSDDQHHIGNEPRHGFCCRNGELFETIEPECLEIGGVFYSDHATAEQTCNPTLPDTSFGACCLQGEVIHELEHECRKAGGAFFSDRGLAYRECRSEPEVPREEFLPAHSWCCARGEVFEAPGFECRQMGGRMYTSPESARRECEGSAPPPELRRQSDDQHHIGNEPRHGFCCRNSELFETIEPECLEIGGVFHSDHATAEQTCHAIRQDDVSKSNIKSIELDQTADTLAEPRKSTIGEIQPIPDFLLVARALPQDPLDRWVKTGGPIGGLGYDVRYRTNDARNQKIMYVTDNYSGVNISTDGGKNWFASNQGLKARTGPSNDAIPVFSLTVDPNNHNIVWAGLKDVSAAYKSVNGGQNWTEVPAKPNRFPKIDAKNPFVFRGFTIQPGNSNVVYAAGEVPQNDMGEAFDRVRGRVYRTSDGGNSWKILWEGNNLTRYVIIHPDNHNILFVSTGIFDREAANSECKGCSAEAMSQPHTIGCRGGTGILKSVDGGATWKELGIKNGLTDLYVGSLVMHPASPNILIAATGNNACSDYRLGGKFKSTGGAFLTVDGGEHWEKTLSNQTITSVEFAPSSPNIAYAAGRRHFYRSTDGGKTWTIVGRKNYPWGPPGAISGFPIDILIDPDDPNTLFVNNYGGGNVKSTDGGATWTIASRGYTGALMFDVEMHPSDTGTVFAAARSGLFSSDDGGRNWRGLSSPPAVFPESYSVALHPHHPNIVLASQELGGKLYRSTNGGNSWEEVFSLPISGDASGTYGFKRIVFAPSAQHIVYAASCRANNHLINNPSAFGVYISKNSGKKGSWVKASGAQLGNKAINDLAVHPTNHNIVWAATASDGLWQSTDSGTSWQKMTKLAPKDVRAVVLDPKNPNIVYAGARKGGVHKGIPGAQGIWTWHKMAAGMDANDDIYSLVVDSQRPSRVWAGSERTGVHFWDSIEQQWIIFNQGLEMRTVFDLDISSDGKVLYAATHGGGVYRLRLSK